MKKKGFDIVTLDEYAKRISKKHADMLYENRLHKKYKRRLFEGNEFDTSDYYKIYVSNELFKDNKIPSKDFIYNIQDIDSRIKFQETPTGIYFYADIPYTYKQLCEYLKDNGYSDYVGCVEKGYEKNFD